MRSFALLVGALLALLPGCRDSLQPGEAPPAPVYSIVLGSTVQDLGVVSGFASSEGRAINNQGQVAGQVSNPGVAFHASLWTPPGPMADLGTLGGSFAFAHGINDLGQVVGESRAADGQLRAFLWTTADGMVDIGDLGGDPPITQAFAINNIGQVVGEAFVGIAAGPFHAFVWSAGTGMRDIGALLASSNNGATDINDLGQVVGTFRGVPGCVPVDLIGCEGAFVWSSTGGERDLPTLGGDFSLGSGINNVGQVVGSSRTAAGHTHAYLWTAAGGMQDLGTLGGVTSNATDVNDLGVVVGWSALPSGDAHAFAWTAEGGMVDLGTVGGCCSRATAINDNGQVTGVSRTAGGGDHAALWTLELSPPGSNELIDQIATGVDNLRAAGTTNDGQANALHAKLNAALRQIARGNATAAINILRAFINQVEGYVDAGTLTAAEAQPLLDAARNAIASLGGTP